MLASTLIRPKATINTKGTLFRIAATSTRY